MVSWPDLWRGFLRYLPRSRYTLSLEDEIARVRAENRALVDSILGIAGIPATKIEAAPPLAPASAHRRRSWQQIGRMLEIEEARRLANRDTTATVQLPNARRS